MGKQGEKKTNKFIVLFGENNTQFYFSSTEFGVF